MRLELDLQEGDERIFVDESLEQIEHLEQGLLAIEGGDVSPATVNEVFRAAHTLKGSAATIRHTRMAHLTHAAESVLGALRDRRLDGLDAFMEPLLEAIDVLRVQVDEVSAGEALTDRPEALTERLVTALAAELGESVTGPATASQGAATSTKTAPTGPVGAQPTEVADPDAARIGALTAPHLAALAGHPWSIVRCVADDASPWKAVRLLQGLLEAHEAEVLIAADPTRDELEQAIEKPSLLLLVGIADTDTDELCRRIAMIDEIAVAPVAMEPLPTVGPAGTAPAGASAPSATVAADGESAERRHADVGPEARGTTVPERLDLAGGRMKLAQQTIRIDVERLDELMNLVGELVVHKTRLMRQAREIGLRLGLDDAMAMEAEAGAEQYARIATQLQDQATRLRMLPIEMVFNRFPRVVRDLSVKLGKDVELVMEGQETELDRSVLEQVGDPLGHLVRNSLDHGIETPEEREAAGKPRTGRVRLAAWHADGRVMIVVEDDGAGIHPGVMRRVAVAKGLLTEAAAAALSDAEAVQLIFAPGFSTARVVTEVSGRGVGTDVVRTNIERLGGRVSVSSVPGKGARFELSLPLTLAIVGSLLVRGGRRVCAIPLSSVVETVRMERSDLRSVRGHRAVVLRDRVIPVQRLDEALGDPPIRDIGTSRFVYLAVVRSNGTELALTVDEFLGEQEIVLKSLTGLSASQPGLAGATVLADGSVALVVDASAVVERHLAHRAQPVGRSA